jgi:hypothetical protein
MYYYLQRHSMSIVEEIQRAVAGLRPEELARFRRWFLEREAEAWDLGIEKDVAAGRLDFLADEALQEHRAGKTRKL